MVEKSKKDKSQENDMFSIVNFGSSGSGNPEDAPSFSIYVKPRSGDIHEFLNTEINVKTAKYLKLASAIRKELSAQPKSHEVEQKIDTEDTNRLVYRKDGKTIEISVTPEQYKSLFAAPSPKEEKELSEDAKPFRVARNPLPDMTEFKRSKDAEAIRPDNSIASSIKADKNLATETLAELHVRQGNKKEAKRIYHKLSLLFPEKSGYFEARIKKLQE